MPGPSSAFRLWFTAIYTGHGGLTIYALYRCPLFLSARRSRTSSHSHELERAAQTASSEARTAMETRMTWLATIAAIAPFIGLFGTVWGIIDAFHGLGTAGAATLRAVAPGISEALITTAAGLVVAIPAVIGYNQFTARLREFGSRMDDFARELLSEIENAAMSQPADPQVQEHRQPHS